MLMALISLYLGGEPVRAGVQHKAPTGQCRLEAGLCPLHSGARDTPGIQPRPRATGTHWTIRPLGISFQLLVMFL